MLLVGKQEFTREVGDFPSIIEYHRSLTHIKQIYTVPLFNFHYVMKGETSVQAMARHVICP